MVRCFICLLFLVSSRIIDAYLAPPRPEVEAPKLKSSQRVLVIDAMHDSFIPPRSRDLLIRSIRSSSARVEHIQLPGDHIQPGSDLLIQKLTATVTSWANSN